jgi:hypothetical protein
MEDADALTTFAAWRRTTRTTVFGNAFWCFYALCHWRAEGDFGDIYAN